MFPIWDKIQDNRTHYDSIQQDSVQFSRSVVFYSLQPHGPQHTRPPCPSQLPEFIQTHVHWVGDAIQPSHALLSPSPLPSIFPSMRVFSNESVLCIRWPKYWSFSFSISPSNQDLFPYCQHPLDHQKSKKVPEKHLLLLLLSHFSSVQLCATP